MAQLVSRQARALGIRVALGATPSHVMRLVLGHAAAAIAAVGLTAGLIGALLSGRVLGAFLFGIQSTDLPTYAVVAGRLGALTLGAGWIPARRAMRLDPADIPRSE